MYSESETGQVPLKNTSQTNLPVGSREQIQVARARSLSKAWAKTLLGLNLRKPSVFLYVGWERSCRLDQRLSNIQTGV